ncbi:MAG TPA: hypothetical protein VGO59_12965, partial [Verrucomicrobiae bacterium]
KDGKVKLDGDSVIEFQKLPETQQVTLKVLRWEERDKRLVIKEAQMVAKTPVNGAAEESGGARPSAALNLV